MYIHDFKLDIDTEELNKTLTEEVGGFIKGEMIDLVKNITNEVMQCLEDFMHERFENVQYAYFKKVVSFLLGSQHYRPHGDEEIKISEWLKGLGYTQQEFRKKIFEENKDVILEQLQYDAIYEKAENMFDASYFKSWDFDDIGRNYPQTMIVRGMLNALVNRDGFQGYLSEYLDKENKERLEQLEGLKAEIASLQDSLNKTLEGYANL